jgi:hypothetical protein
MSFDSDGKSDFGTYYAFTIQIEIENGKLMITKNR